LRFLRQTTFGVKSASVNANYDAENIAIYQNIAIYRTRESRAVARKPRGAAAVLFADNIHYKFKSSQAWKARLQSYKHPGAKQNLTQNGHSRSCVLVSVER